MNRASEILNESRKIVIKIGSNVLASPSGELDPDSVANIVSQVAELRQTGKQVIIVSSGAGVSGASVAGLLSRREDINYKQAICAIGQVELMLAYKKHFAKYGAVVGQLLLTRNDFESGESSLHIRNTLFTLVDEGFIPIVNENDSVGVEEFNIGDNDMLASLTANLWNADLLILMSDIDGLYDSSPKKNGAAKLIETVTDIDSLSATIDTSGKSSFGTGGMSSKIEAARLVGQHGKPTLLVNGKKFEILTGILGGENTGTVFCQGHGS
jgi:glutamate 5-kinase